MTVTGLPMLPDIIGDQQAVLPYFMITDVTKTMNGVSVRAIQMHDLSGAVPVPGEQEEPDAPQVLIGDVDNDGEAYTINDFRYLVDFTIGDGVLDEQQLLNADINGDGSVDILDLVSFFNNVKASMGDDFLPGDANLDGVVTEADLELVQSYIDNPNTSELTMAGFINADMNVDFQITEADIEAIDALLPPDEAVYTGQLLIDTTNYSEVGIISLGYINGEIVFTTYSVVGIDPASYQLGDFLQDLENNDLTLVGTNITFQPIFTGELDYTNGDIINITYPWLEVAGDYTINAIEYDTAFGGLYTFRLDASGIDSTGLTQVGIAANTGGADDVNVKIYGTPESTSNDSDEVEYAELLSTRHHYAASGFNSDVGTYSYQTGVQYQPSSQIITGSDNTIAPNATLAELREAFPDVFNPNSGIYCKINVSYHQEYEDYYGAPSDANMVRINNWLLFDGFLARFTAGNSTFFRMAYDQMLYPNGEPLQTVNIGNNFYLDMNQDGNIIQVSSTSFGLYSSSEDYIILTISYPVESNE